MARESLAGDIPVLPAGLGAGVRLGHGRGARSQGRAPVPAAKGQGQHVAPWPAPAPFRWQTAGWVFCGDPLAASRGGGQGDVLATGKGFPSTASLRHPQPRQRRGRRHLPSSMPVPRGAVRLPLQQRAPTHGSDLTVAAVGASSRSPRWRGRGQGEPRWGHQRGAGMGPAVTCPRADVNQ